MAAIKYCPWPRCSVKTKGGYCERHKKQRRENFARRDKTNKRPGSTQRGYDAAWQRLRASYMLDHPFCEYCNERAEELDHVIPLSEGGKRLSKNNVVALCRECHRRKHAAKDRIKKSLNLEVHDGQAVSV